MRRYVNSGPGLLTECVLLRGKGFTFRSVLGLLGFSAFVTVENFLSDRLICAYKDRNAYLCAWWPV
jgi:hypothetical protein